MRPKSITLFSIGIYETIVAIMQENLIPQPGQPMSPEVQETALARESQPKKSGILKPEDIPFDIMKGEDYFHALTRHYAELSQRALEHPEAIAAVNNESDWQNLYDIGTHVLAEAGPQPPMVDDRGGTDKYRQYEAKLARIMRGEEGLFENTILIGRHDGSSVRIRFVPDEPGMRRGLEAISSLSISAASSKEARAVLATMGIQNRFVISYADDRAIESLVDVMLRNRDKVGNTMIAGNPSKGSLEDMTQ